MKKVFLKNSKSAFLLSAKVVVMAITISLVATSCKKDKDDDGPKEEPYVDINNPQSIQDALKIDNATYAQTALPESTDGNYDLSESINSVEVNSAGTVMLPLIYNGSDNIKEVYLQVVGANGHFSAPPVTVTRATGYCYIAIKMPKNIDDGSFYIQYLVKDNGGSLSNLVTTIINITNDVVSCDNAYNSGSSGLTFTTVYLGTESGNVSIYYDTYWIPDRIDIYQGNQWITGTGEDPHSLIPPMCDCDDPLPGFIGDDGYLDFYFDASKGDNIVVVVSGCLNEDTWWDWILMEAPNCK